MSRGVLMVAFHVPPFAGSTGAIRTISFARYLPEHGWRPTVLWADVRSYGSSVTPEDLIDVPSGLEVNRAFALDVARHLSFRGAYPSWLATPDRWNTWLLGAVPKALKLIKLHRVRALWSTYPIASSVLIGLVLRRLTGVPWILDLRDPLVYAAWPVDPWTRRVYTWIERRAVHEADKIVVTTPGAMRLYRERYPTLPMDKIHIIANGVEDEVLAAVQSSGRAPVTGDGTVHLVHAGLLEVPDRDPSAFFAATANLIHGKRFDGVKLKITLRASGQETQNYQRTINALAIPDYVTLAPRIPYRDALAEMLAADGLLLFQGPACNDQIPAKVYEYFASAKPIIGLVDDKGDTCALLRSSGVPYLADMLSPDDIAQVLERFISDIVNDAAWRPPTELIARHSRRARTADLAAVLNSLDDSR